MSELRQEVKPAEVGLDPAALRRLDTHVARLVDEGRLPGYLIAIARHGCVAHLTSYGLRDREAGVAVGTDTIWRIHSMTKPIVSVAALMLQDEGLLDGNAGVGFGFGVSVVIDPARTESPSSPGLYGWSGAAGTTFWIDPQHDLTVQFLTQVRTTAGPTWFADLRRLVHDAVAG